MEGARNEKNNKNYQMGIAPYARTVAQPSIIPT